jgi:hypothetical protein
MKKTLFVALMVIANIANAAWPVIKDGKPVPVVQGSEIKMLDTNTCWAIIKEMKIPSAQPNFWAFKTTWYPNSKGQAINIWCQSDMYKGPSYVEIVPMKVIKDELAGRKAEVDQYQKDQKARAKSSGIM